MRLIDAEKIEEFASRYTEFDGKPLTKREKKALNRHYGEILTVVKGGGADGQSTADSF